MIWTRPWALAGLVLLALPVIIHMMGRGRAKVLHFPSLRFLEASRLLPARRTRIHDVALLVLRCAAIAAAAVALAGPLWSPRDAGAAPRDELNRLIIVDTSASMARMTPSGATALAAARRFADSLKASGSLHTVIESAQPSLALPGAAAWLATQRGNGEIDIISDFQLGTLDSVALAAVPPAVGLRFMRVPLGVLGRPGPPAPLVRSTLADVVTVLAGSAERAESDAAREAARAAGRLVRPGAPGASVGAPESTAIRLVHPRYERRAELLRSAVRFTEELDVALVARVIADSLLAQAAVDATLANDSSSGAGGRGAATVPPGAVVVARNRAGAVVAFAAPVTAGATHSVAFFSNVDAGSATSVALHLAIARATQPAPPASEFEAETVTDVVLASWQRAPGAAPRSTDASELSDGNPLDTTARWLWIAALAALVIESWARNSPRFANTIRADDVTT